MVPRLGFQDNYYTSISTLYLFTALSSLEQVDDALFFCRLDWIFKNPFLKTIQKHSATCLSTTKTHDSLGIFKKLQEGGEDISYLLLREIEFHQGQDFRITAIIHTHPLFIYSLPHPV